MKVCIHISASDALKAGLDDHGYKVVEVPAASLTPEQREELARHRTWSGPAEKLGADFDVTKSPHSPVRATAEEAIACIRSIIDARDAEAAEAKAKHEAQVDFFLHAPLAEFFESGNPGSRRLRPIGADTRPYYKVPDDPRLAARLEEARAELERLKAEDEAKREAERKAKQEGLGRLKRWAESRGSELLRARIADGYEWESLAEAEFGESVFAGLGLGRECPTPGGYELGRGEDRTTPTLEEIEALRAFRARIEATEAPAVASLAWIKYNPIEDPDDYDHADDREPIRRCEIAIKVTTPTGSERDYYVLPEAANA